MRRPEQRARSPPCPSCPPWAQPTEADRLIFLLPLDRHATPAQNTTMEMDAAATAAVAAPTAVECSVVDQVAQPSAQSTATAPTVLPRGKKEMMPEASGGGIEETSCPTGRG
jgi:hypothetical protein